VAGDVDWERAGGGKGEIRREEVVMWMAEAKVGGGAS